MAATEQSTRANVALDDLYRRHVGDVYRYTYAVLGNHADAEDVTQTTFVNALRALERGEQPRNASNWLLAIAHNLVRQRWRQAAARPTEIELVGDVAADAQEDDLELDDLVKALQRIPPAQREALVMRELEGRSYQEISELLGVTNSALETLLFRARRSLADELENLVTCQTAELAMSQRLDGRLSRKERRRLKEHLGECAAVRATRGAAGQATASFQGPRASPAPCRPHALQGRPVGNGGRRAVVHRRGRDGSERRERSERRGHHHDDRRLDGRRRRRCGRDGRGGSGWLGRGRGAREGCSCRRRGNRGDRRRLPGARGHPSGCTRADEAPGRPSGYRAREGHDATGSSASLGVLLARARRRVGAGQRLRESPPADAAWRRRPARTDRRCATGGNVGEADGSGRPDAGHSVERARPVARDASDGCASGGRDDASHDGRHRAPELEQSPTGGTGASQSSGSSDTTNGCPGGGTGPGSGAGCGLGNGIGEREVPETGGSSAGSNGNGPGAGQPLKEQTGSADPGKPAKP